MTGKQLYEMYRKAMREEACEVDPWRHLTVTDQEAWEKVAYKVVLK